MNPLDLKWGLLSQLNWAKWGRLKILNPNQCVSSYPDIYLNNKFVLWFAKKKILSFLKMHRHLFWFSLLFKKNSTMYLFCFFDPTYSKNIYYFSRYLDFIYCITCSTWKGCFIWRCYIQLVEVAKIFRQIFTA